MASIKFGTSGWRGLIARDFTFDNVRLATEGIALYLKAELGRPGSAIAGREPVVILGYDGKNIHSIETPFGPIGAHRFFICGLVSLSHAIEKENRMR